MTRNCVTSFEVASPLGLLRGAATAHGLALISLPGSDHDASLARLADGAAIVRGVHPAERALAAYFAGDDADFDLPVDLRHVAPFGRLVLAELRRVPHGRLVTYGELARRVGRPGAARAVGGAVGANPIPIVVPCHRVVSADSRLGGFSGGLDAKRRLLEIEGHDVVGPTDGRWSRARVAPRTVATSA